MHTADQTLPEIRDRVRWHLRPALSFFKKYFDVMCSSHRLGVVSVFFCREAMEEAMDGISLESYVFPEFLGRQYEIVADVGRTKDFCRHIRHTPEGERRCQRCDLMSTTRISHSKRPQLYECHAGLTDMMAPVVVHGVYVGVVCTGQWLREGRGPRTFEEVWGRIADIPGLERDLMEKCFADLPLFPEDVLKDLQHRVADAAQTLAELWEGMVALSIREKQLSRVQQYQERDLAEMLLGGAAFSHEEALVRARALGMEDLPNRVLLIRMDPTRNGRISRQSDGFAELVDAVHSLRREIPSALITSISMGEVAVLIRQLPTRNPELARLRMRELGRLLRDTVARRTGITPLVGVGPECTDMGQLADAYQEARRSMWVNGTADPDTHEPLTYAATALANRCDELLEQFTDLDGLVQNLGTALRLLGGLADHEREMRRILFLKVVDACIRTMKKHGLPQAPLETLRTQIVVDLPSLQSTDDIVAWYATHLRGPIEALGQQTEPQSLRLAEQACHYVQQHLAAELDRPAVAECLGVSDGGLGKIFGTRLGLPFRRYVLMCRMAKAQAMLCGTTLPVSDIALEVGYSSISTFTRAFAQVCGVPPSVYRDSPASGQRIVVPTPHAEPLPELPLV